MEQKIELVIKILTKYFQDLQLKKPTLFHSMKVWFYLYDRNFDIDIILWWFLHDILEDTEISEQEIIELFWENVLNIVKANTKDRLIDKEFVNSELIKRCAEYWEDALIVKSADILCNFDYYNRIWNQSEIDRCKKLANLVFEYKNSSYSSSIFEELYKLI